MLYTVRVHSIGRIGILMSADVWEDFTIDTTETLPKLAERLNREGFSDGDKWIMPGAIMWIKRKQ